MRDALLGGLVFSWDFYLYKYIIQQDLVRLERRPPIEYFILIIRKLLKYIYFSLYIIRQNVILITG